LGLKTNKLESKDRFSSAWTLCESVKENVGFEADEKILEK
jgi:hypothetical protein